MAVFSMICTLGWALRTWESRREVISLAGFVLVVKNAGLAVGAFTGIEQRAVLRAGKIHAVADQLPDGVPGGTDHNVHRLFAVFVVAGFEGVVKKKLW